MYFVRMRSYSTELKWNSMKKAFLLTLSFILISCTPKYDFVKTKFDNGKPQVKNIMLVLDYVTLKDDVGKLYDFDENYNLKHMNLMYSKIKSLVETRGFSVLPETLKASGLLIDSEYQAEHYLNKKLQKDLISPPFILRITGMDDDMVDVLRDLNLESRAHLGYNIATEVKTYKYGTLPSLENLNKLNLPEHTAILVINANRPKVSAIKAIGVGVLSTALTGGYATVAMQGIPSTFGYLVHADTGDILWTNYGAADNFNKNSKFMKLFPDFSTYNN